MNEQEILPRLEILFADVFDEDDIALKPETSPDDIEEWDSLSQIELLMAIEGEFGKKIPIEDAMNIHCVQDIITTLEKLLA